MITIRASIVIWYNPETLGKDTAINNILTYSKFFNQIYIIDNSSGDNKGLARQIPNSHYIPNFNNLGIATALNQGCESAMNDGCTWVMTMDQDSSWDYKYLSSYIQKTDSIYQIDNLVRSISPNTVHQNEIHSVLGAVKHNLLKKRVAEKKDKKNEFEYVDRTISSGNIINLETWKVIGGFNKELFINDVDYDFCYRIIQKGYKIVKILNCNMYHVDGDPQKTFFPHAFPYHEERIYYLVRNKYYILKKYPQFAKKYRYRQTIRRILFEKIFFLEFMDLKYVLKGIADGRHDNYGKFCGDKGPLLIKESDMLNIFCLGAISEDYRTKNTLNFFLTNEDYRVFYNDFDKPVSYKSFCPTSMKKKFFKFLSIISNFFYMLHADIIYVFAMQHGSFPIQLAFFFKKKLVVDFYLSFYDTEINDYKHFIPNSKEAKRIKKTDREALINSRMVFFLNQSEAIYYTKILNIDINTINYRILPLCIDEKPQANIGYFLGKRECLNLCWCGSYVPLQGLDVIITAVSILKEKMRLHLYIWGASDKRSELYQNMVKNLHIQDIVTIHNEWGNRKKWEEFIVKNCDISLGIFGKSMKAKTVLANKVLDGIAFHTPVITAHSVGLYEYFNGKDDIFVTENTPEALASMIEYVKLQNYSTHKKRIATAYKKYKENFSPNCFYKKLNLYINELKNRL